MITTHQVFQRLYRLREFFSIDTSQQQKESQPFYIDIDNGVFDGRSVASLVSSSVNNGNTVVLRKNGHELEIKRGKSNEELVINLASAPEYLSFLHMFDLIGALVANQKEVIVYCGKREVGKRIAGLLRALGKGKLISKIDRAAGRRVFDKPRYFPWSGKVFVSFSSFEPA